MKNEAIGAYEAACLMGLHFSRPKKLVDSGILQMKVIAGGNGRKFAIFPMRQCEQLWREYEDLVRSGELMGRPRAYESMRPAALKALGTKGRVQIAYDDAIGIDEAAEILRVYPTRVPRMIEEGRLVARRLWSDRAGTARIWIVSRESAEKLCRELDKSEAAGTKRGRRRQSA